MAERRMFTKAVVDSDDFLEMPASGQLLYFFLALHADDDGFVNKPRSLARMTGGTEQDLQLLCKRQFLICFDSGIAVIRHWRMHNSIRKDTYNPTKYTFERSLLELDDGGVYHLRDASVTEPLRSRNEPSPQVRIGKDRLGKVRSGKENTSSTPPTPEQVRQYCQSRASPVDPQDFWDHYTANGWTAGEEKIKDWKAMVRAWERREPKKKGANPFLEMAVGSG